MQRKSRKATSFLPHDQPSTPAWCPCGAATPGTSSPPHRNRPAASPSPSLCASSARWWTSWWAAGLSTCSVLVSWELAGKSNSQGKQPEDPDTELSSQKVPGTGPPTRAWSGLREEFTVSWDQVTVAVDHLTAVIHRSTQTTSLQQPTDRTSLWY